jgi:hypothetical protein
VRKAVFDSTILGGFVEARSRLRDGGFVLAAPGLEARRRAGGLGTRPALPTVRDSVEAVLADRR